HGFDVASEPPLRAHLFVLGEREHVLLLLVHHIACDGWSTVSLARDVAAFYRAGVEGGAPELAALPVQYADYTLWQASVLGEESDPESVISRQLAYWTARLKELPEQLDLPVDRSRPAVSTYRGASVPLRVGGDLHVRLLALARENHASLFMVLQAALATLLTRLGTGADIPIGSPIAGRTDSALNDLVGFFVNTLVLRTDTSGNPSFRELIGRVRTSNLSDYSHQELPFERLVEVLNPPRSLSRHPLFQVSLVLHNEANVTLERLPQGLTAMVEPVDIVSAKFDLSITMTEQRGADGQPSGLDGLVEYAIDLFHQSSMDAFAARFVRLLEQAVAEPEQPIGSLDLLTAAERHTLLYEWNDTARAVTPATLLDLFAERVARAPDAIAAVCEQRTLSYGALDARANQLAHHLRALGVGPEVVVGVCLERSLEMLIALIGILKAGGAYLPLDPSHPRERLAFMLSDAGAPVLVTQSALREGLDRYRARTVCLDSEADAIARRPSSPPASAREAHNLAYVIYTSGSTGTPKGVAVTHGGIPNLALAEIERLGITSAARVLQFAPLSFDATVWEISAALAAGAVLVLAGAERAGETLAQLIAQQRVSHATLPPAVVASMEEDLPLATLVVAGEACPAPVAARWSAGRRMINAYGPTESTVCASMSDALSGDGDVPIGRPISNTRVYVLDAGLQPVPAGVAGELYICGLGL
ncbi:MAG: AMP-binding protein, partial [Hyphomicrobiaceae bacterium]|nr:AMP-binding protein [Hyphomicrobiaceae bacterium]